MRMFVVVEVIGGIGRKKGGREERRGERENEGSFKYLTLQYRHYSIL